jgi:hypothetical protein
MGIIDKQAAGVRMIAGVNDAERSRQAATLSGVAVRASAFPTGLAPTSLSPASDAPCSPGSGAGDRPFPFGRTDRGVDTAKSDK